jgi:hypothetical protein
VGEVATWRIEMTEHEEVDQLLKIEEWLDTNGWDKLSSQEFTQWLESVGIKRSDVIIHCCRERDMLP